MARRPDWLPLGELRNADDESTIAGSKLTIK